MGLDSFLEDTLGTLAAVRSTMQLRRRIRWRPDLGIALFEVPDQFGRLQLIGRAYVSPTGPLFKKR